MTKIDVHFLMFFCSINSCNSPKNKKAKPEETNTNELVHRDLLIGKYGSQQSPNATQPIPIIIKYRLFRSCECIKILPAKIPEIPVVKAGMVLKIPSGSQVFEVAHKCPGNK